MTGGTAQLRLFGSIDSAGPTVGFVSQVFTGPMIDQPIEWDVTGFRPVESSPGFHHLDFESRLTWTPGSFHDTITVGSSYRATDLSPADVAAAPEPSTLASATL